MPHSEPLEIRVQVPRVEALFDEEPAGFPYPHPVLREATSRYLVDAARRGRSSPTVALAIEVDGAPLSPDAEADVRAKLGAYFRAEGESAHRDIELNHVEGMRSLFLSLVGSLIAVAVVLPVRFYVGDPFFLFEFILVVIIWVLMWDSIEMLVYDSQMLRMRRRAIRKLERAPIRFTYRSGVASPAARPVSGTGQI